MNKKEITLGAVGDIMLGGELLKYMDNKGVDYKHPFEKIEELFSKFDVVFCNLECPLFKSGPKRSEDWILYSSPESIVALKQINCDIVSLGNNHITDYGGEGLIETREFLENNGIKAVGAGKNQKDASKGVILEKQGIKIGFLAYLSRNYPNSTIATENIAGCASYENLNKVQKDVEEIKKSVDRVCVSLHWGDEFFSYPSPEQIEIAHRIIDFGCDIIIGHHPHVVQGVEEYNNGIIVYSLGNFFNPDFDRVPSAIYRHPEECKHSFILECTSSQRNIKNYKIIPCIVNDEFQVIEEKGVKAYEKIKRLSSDLEEKNYKKFWDSYKAEKNKELERTERRMEIKMLVRRMRSLGFWGCLEQISITTIAHSLKILFSYFLLKLGRK